ncbi:MAG: elongation factor P maturation arginine rhamnosyltransferase EarP [Betaproteobacteria bacterium]|nr:elongation factor P maturation arginine rhamnosyltransferase EarP [Betaproteobacteria bacterium]
MPVSPSYDVFCRVVDHFGDAGICWRLARQLAREHGFAVTLWIDDRAVLARIAPVLDARCDDQIRSGVRVRRLAAPMPEDAKPADVVIEGFGCGVPEPYLAAMAARAHAPVWINLEYLSAEAWIETSHGLPSPNPRLPLTRWFFFPGFTNRTGGLLREHDLLATRDAALVPAEDSTVRSPEDGGAPAEVLTVSLYCYPNSALPALFDVWSEGDKRIVCNIPDCVARSELDRWLGGNVPHQGTPIERGRLTLIVHPFVAQDSFDRRLWSSDVNFVRGEDSFVRAQWAARPFIWHIYPQAAAAHAAKLEAFLARYTSGLHGVSAAAVRDFWRAFNAGDGAATATAWPSLRASLPVLSTHGRAWASALAQQSDLATRLVNFAASRL